MKWFKIIKYNWANQIQLEILLFQRVGLSIIGFKELNLSTLIHLSFYDRIIRFSFSLLNIGIEFTLNLNKIYHETNIRSY